MTTHPYYVGKAREVLAAAGGDPDAAGPLAEWAQANHHREAAAGAIVARDGSVVAEAETVRPSGMDGVAVTWIADADFERLGLRYQALDGAIAELKARGMEVIYVKRWEVTRGAGRHITGSALAAVDAAARARRAATETLDGADETWRHQIRAALDAGHSLAEVAAVAGVTRARVAQIRDGRR